MAAVHGHQTTAFTDLHLQVTLHFAECTPDHPSSKVLLSVRRIVRADGSTQTHFRDGGALSGAVDGRQAGGQWEAVSQVSHVPRKLLQLQLACSCRH